MDLDDSLEEARHRQAVRAWLEQAKASAPPATGQAADMAYIASRRDWQRRLAEAGLVGVTWPAEFGGQGLGPAHQVIVNQEMAAAGVPGPIDVIGIGLMGPCIMAHGTREQKQRYLGPMLHGDEVWCQLFSEPAAGSDLAGVQTRAVPSEDGGWKLTGQKVWTTNAQFAEFGMALARSDAGQPKHNGLTMFIVPMDAAGVMVRGLRQISGEAEFNEVFLDEVPVGADAVVGTVNGGWSVALTVLMFERMMIGLGFEGHGYRAERFAQALAAERAAAQDADVRQRLGRLACELLAIEFAGYRTRTALAQGQIPGPELGLTKVTTVNAAIAAAELIVDVLGPDALVAASEWAYLTSFLPGLRSAGGTEQILRNTVGERVLGLPPEPRVDKGIPFRELTQKQRAA